MRCLILALACTGCGLFGGYPDPRNAAIVAHDPQHAAEARFAVEWWNASTGQVSMTVGTRCEDDRACVYMVWETLSGDDAGRNQNKFNPITGESGSLIRIDPKLRDEPAQLRNVIAHEIGHALHMEHVGDELDLMYEYSSEYACIGPETLAQWEFYYGTCGDCHVVCVFDVEPSGDSD